MEYKIKSRKKLIDTRNRNEGYDGIFNSLKERDYKVYDEYGEIYKGIPFTLIQMFKENNIIFYDGRTVRLIANQETIFIKNNKYWYVENFSHYNIHTPNGELYDITLREVENPNN